MFILGGTDDIQVLLDDSQVGKCVLAGGADGQVWEKVWRGGQWRIQGGGGPGCLDPPPPSNLNMNIISV